MNLAVESVALKADATSSKNSLTRQFRRLIPLFCLIYVPSLLILTGLFLVWLLTDVPIGELTRDPLSVVENRINQARLETNSPIIDSDQLLPVQPWLGAVSSLGIIFWSITGAVGVFTAWVITPRRTVLRTKAGFFLGAGVLSFMLMADDLFLIHERVLPDYLGLGEEFLFGLYGFLLASIIYVWRRYILTTDYLLLLLAMVFFATSLIIDELPFHIRQRHFFEDGAKFVGIVTWSAYIWRNAVQALHQHFATDSAKQS